MFYPQSCTSWSTASSEYLGKKLIRCKMIQSVNEWTEPRSSGRLVALIQKFVINIQLNIVTQDDTLTCCSWRLWLVRQEDCKGAKGRHKTANTSVDAPSDYPINRASLQKIGVYLQVQCWSLLSNPGSPLYIAKNAMSQKSMWMGTKHNLDACVIAFSQTIKGIGGQWLCTLSRKNPRRNPKAQSTDYFATSMASWRRIPSWNWRKLKMVQIPHLQCRSFFQPPWLLWHWPGWQLLLENLGIYACIPHHYSTFLNSSIRFSSVYSAYSHYD